MSNIQSGKTLTKSLIVAASLAVTTFGVAQVATAQVEAAGSAYKVQTAADTQDRPTTSGEWIKKTSKTKGTWTVSTVDGVTTISLDEKFSTKSAPDLKILLSPLTAKEAKNKTAINGSLVVSPLRSNEGAQSYTVPAGTDLSQYNSVLIHCEAYTKLWAAFDL